jgi:hypothetical protein
MGSPNPLDVLLVLRPLSETSLDNLPIGTNTEMIAERLNTGRILTKPAVPMVASKLDPGMTLFERSKGFALPPMEELITGTALVPIKVFQ